MNGPWARFLGSWIWSTSTINRIFHHLAQGCDTHKYAHIKCTHADMNTHLDSHTHFHALTQLVPSPRQQTKAVHSGETSESVSRNPWRLPQQGHDWPRSCHNLEIPAQVLPVGVDSALSCPRGLPMTQWWVGKNHHRSHRSPRPRPGYIVGRWRRGLRFLWPWSPTYCSTCRSQSRWGRLERHRHFH